jgi:hypothetical protein
MLMRLPAPQSPGSLAHAGDLPLERQVPETNAAEPEFSQVRPCSTALATPLYRRVENFGFSFIFSICDLRATYPPMEIRLLPERHTEPRQQGVGFLIGFGRCDDGDVHAVNPRNLVVIDLGEDNLFF